MPTLNYYLELQQDIRELADIEANNLVATINSYLHEYGQSDGKYGLLPQAEYWDEDSYQSGYLDGLKQYYNQMFKLK